MELEIYPYDYRGKFYGVARYRGRYYYLNPLGRKQKIWTKRLGKKQHFTYRRLIMEIRKIFPDACVIQVHCSKKYKLHPKFKISDTNAPLV